MPHNVDDDCMIDMHLVKCSPDQNFCWEEFTGNTMTQYSPNGQLMFLHTNLSPKWNLMVPGNFEAYTRRCCLSAAEKTTQARQLFTLMVEWIWYLIGFTSTLW